MLLGKEETCSDTLYLLWLPYPHEWEGSRVPGSHLLCVTLPIPGSIPIAVVNRSIRSLLSPANLFPFLLNKHSYSLISTTYFMFMRTFLFMPWSLDLISSKLLPLVTSFCNSQYFTRITSILNVFDIFTFLLVFNQELSLSYEPQRPY